MRASTSSELVGTSPEIREIKNLISQVAETDAPVMLFGESGTGKELVARGLHNHSCRHHQPFIPVNMAAMPSSLVESILFGHDRGAFTGADSGRSGLVEEANRGTLFLDEIGEMEYDAQSKLLRFLQDMSYRRVGSTRSRLSDTRIVSATNRDASTLVKEGIFREDLYYRLNVVPINIPPLRKRRSDVPLLVDRFVQDVATRYHKGPFEVSSQAMYALVSYDWPGNVRELKNVIERIVILSRRILIGVEQLPPEISGRDAAEVTPPQNLQLHWNAAEQLSAMEQLQKNAIVQALGTCGGNVRLAAEALGIGQATAYRRIKQYGIPLRRGAVAT